MIIPGAHRIELATGGLGFAVRDARRPDIGPVRPGYLLIPGASTLVPSPPVFDAVTAADGYLTVDVHSPGSVDGYEIGVSTTILPPDTWWSTASGHLVQPLATGTYYLFARAHYQGAYSTWSQYGQLAPGQDEWRLSWSDEGVSGTDHTAYPYATVRYGHTSGWQYATAGGMRIHQHTAYVDAYGLSTLAASGGVHGVRIDTVLNIGLVYPAAKAGVAWGFDPAAMAAAPTTTPYYGLCIRRADGHEYLGLYHVVDQTATLLAEADVTAYMTSRTEGGGTSEYVEVSIQARESAVTVCAEGVSVISATATGITWSDTLTGVGLWYQGSGNYGYTDTSYMDGGVEDYIRVYARDHTGEAETVTPGAVPHNDLDGRSEAACHPASAVSVTPSGGIAATNVQSALAELDGEKAPAVHTHDDRYYTETELQTSGSAQVHWDNITNEPATYPPSSHTHAGSDITSQVGDAHTVDGLHSSSLVQTSGAQTVAGVKTFSESLDLSKAVKSSTGTASPSKGSPVRILFPGGGGYDTHLAANTGAIKITLPASWTTTFVSFTVRVHEFGNGSGVCNVFDALVSGYNTASAWFEASAHISNSVKPDNHTVRFGHDGSKCVVYIGELTSLWFYPQIYILDVTLGYDTSSAASWETGWAIGFESSAFQNVTKTISNCQIGLYHAGAKIWNEGNDGAGSGLVSDAVDDVHLSGLCQWGGSASSAPDGVEGKIYKNTSDGKVYIYAGGAWVALT